MSEEDFSLLEPEEIDAKIEETQIDPYYLTSRPEGMVASQQKHDRAVQTLTRLLKVKYPEPEHEQVFDADGKNVTPVRSSISRQQYEAFSEALDEKEAKSEAAQKKLTDDLRQELELLVEAWGDDCDIDIEDELGEPTVPKLAGYRQLRMLATGDYKNLEPSIIKDVQSLGTPAHQVEAIRHFFQVAEPSNPMTEDIANIIIRHIHKAKKGEN